MRKRKVSNLKQFDAYIEGDGELRKIIFSEAPASQQVIFELFSQLDHTYYSLFLTLAAVPSSTFWDILLSQLSAISSGSARNRNFCEDYELLKPVKEDRTCHSSLRGKALDLVGASHALWFDLADPFYSEKPNTVGLWTALSFLNPSRMVWEWWFESRAREAKKIIQDIRKDPATTEDRLIAWGNTIGLLNSKKHAFTLAKEFTIAFDLATDIKHKIAKPYLRLVYTITKSIAAYNQPGQFFDTFNIACAGLMRSIAKYAPSMAMAFSNFADREIRYEIYYQLGNYNLVALPHKSWQRYREFETLRKQYFSENGKEPSLEDLIKTHSLPREEVYEIYRQVAMQNPHSLDQKVFNEDRASNNQATLKDRIEDPRTLENRRLLENQEVLLLALLRLSQQSRKIFIAAQNLCDLVQDLPPQKDELEAFFFGKNIQQRACT